MDKILHHSSELEQGDFYKLNKEGRYDKVEEVIPTKDTNENISKNYFEKIFLKLKNPIELLKKLKKVEFNNVLNKLFSTKGLISLLVFIIAFGGLISLIPIFLSKTNSTMSSSTHSTFIANPISTSIEVTTTTLSTITTTNKCVSTTAKSIIPSTYDTNSCPSNRVYQPSFLTTKNSYSHGYPILQAIICFGGSLDLKCPTSSYLNIYSAYYGIQHDTTTYCTRNSNTKSPSICYSSSSYDTIKYLCQEKNNCKVGATSFYFTDPCNSFKNKQLFVQYQCVDSATLSKINSCITNSDLDSICPSLNNPAYQENKDWCNLSELDITCTGGKKINILCALYGIDPNYRPCALASTYIGAPTACNSYDTLILIKLACNGKSSCDPITSSVTNIACPSSFALNLWVQWECVDSSSYKTTISSQNITDSIDYCSDSSYVPLDSCPTQSVLVPSLLIDSKTTNFDYPIYQHIACYNAKLHIQCQAETIIHIYAVYYGIQSETSSDCVSRTNLAAITAEAPAQCWSPLTYDRVAFLCEYKTSCLLTSSAIGLYVVDICPDYKTRQQLLVQYQCIDLILFNQTVGKCNKNKSIPSICPPVIDNEGTWCDNTLGNGAIMKIDCPAGTKIKIVCGFYGIHPSISTCNLQSSSSPVCYFNSSFSHLSNLCNGKNSCSINDFASIFLDPCGGLDKTLYVQWNCT